MSSRIEDNAMVSISHIYLQSHVTRFVKELLKEGRREHIRARPMCQVCRSESTGNVLSQESDQKFINERSKSSRQSHRKRWMKRDFPRLK